MYTRKLTCTHSLTLLLNFIHSISFITFIMYMLLFALVVVVLYIIIITYNLGTNEVWRVECKRQWPKTPHTFHFTSFFCFSFSIFSPPHSVALCSMWCAHHLSGVVCTQCVVCWCFFPTLDLQYSECITFCFAIPVGQYKFSFHWYKFENYTIVSRSSVG